MPTVCPPAIIYALRTRQPLSRRSPTRCNSMAARHSRTSGEMMAKITAAHLAEQLRLAGLVVMRGRRWWRT
jgi:hypothetical protein